MEASRSSGGAAAKRSREQLASLEEMNPVSPNQRPRDDGLQEAVSAQINFSGAAAPRIEFDAEKDRIRSGPGVLRVDATTNMFSLHPQDPQRKDGPHMVRYVPHFMDDEGKEVHHRDRGRVRTC